MPEYEGKFDRVLCDVPCSGLGVIFKKPDIKYKPIENINALPSVQYDILKNSAKYVKKGGVLVYSTCTLNSAENENNIRDSAWCSRCSANVNYFIIKTREAKLCNIQQ